VIFRISTLRTVLAVAAFAAGLHWGIVGVAAFYAVMTVPVQMYLVFIVTRELRIRPRVFAGNIAGVARAAAAMFGSCLLARLLLVHVGLGPSIRLIVVIIVGAAVYLPAIAWWGREVLADLRSLRVKKGVADAVDEGTVNSPEFGTLDPDDWADWGEALWTAPDLPRPRRW